jgi:hypothetical protein
MMASIQTTLADITSSPHHVALPTLHDIELLQHTDNDMPHNETSFSLPPTDGGKDAWLCLFGCFMLEAMIWGFPSCYGVFQEYYATSDEFAGQRNIAVVGACAMVFHTIPR